MWGGCDHRIGGGARLYCPKRVVERGSPSLHRHLRHGESKPDGDGLRHGHAMTVALGPSLRCKKASRWRLERTITPF